MAEKLTKFERELIEAVNEMKTGTSVPMPASVSDRRRGRPPQEVTKVAVKLRLDRDLVEELRDTGPGWQTRANAALRREFLKQPRTTAVAIIDSAWTLGLGPNMHVLPVSGVANSIGYPFNLQSGISL